MNKKLIAVVLTTIMLNGCVPVALVGAGAAVGGAVASDSRTLQAMSDDNTIQFQANQKILADKPLVEEARINVTVFNYVVLLTGEVPSAAERAKAESLVQSVPLVRRVYNQLQIAPTLGVLQAADDSTISANIHARMMVTSDLNSNNFKYVVENKVVYLMGYASAEQTRMALNVIRNSSGVKRVVNLVQIKNSDQADASLPSKPPVEDLTNTGSTPSTVTANSNAANTTAAPEATASNPAMVTDSQLTSAQKADAAPAASQETVGTTAFVPVTDNKSA